MHFYINQQKKLEENIFIKAHSLLNFKKVANKTLYVFGIKDTRSFGLGNKIRLLSKQCSSIDNVENLKWTKNISKIFFSE